MKSQGFKTDRFSHAPTSATQIRTRRLPTVVRIWPLIPGIDLLVLQARHAGQVGGVVNNLTGKSVLLGCGLLNDVMYIIPARRCRNGFLQLFQRFWRVVVRSDIRRVSLNPPCGSCKEFNCLTGLLNLARDLLQNGGSFPRCRRPFVRAFRLVSPRRVLFACRGTGPSHRPPPSTARRSDCLSAPAADRV